MLLVKCALLSAPTFNPSQRRNSESMLPTIKKKERGGRKFSLIDRKDLKEVSCKFRSTPKEDQLQEVAEPEVFNEPLPAREENCVSLPRIPSVTPEPDIIRREGQKNDNIDSYKVQLPDIAENPSYRPKYCWCLRCQLMFTMFRTGDPHLENWGNYPCFHR